METTNQLTPLKYGVYVQTDKQGRIININSDAHGIDLTGWIKIDEGLGDRYHHAQGNYFDTPLIDQDGCHNYYLVDGVPVQATSEQKAAELAARPVPGPTMEQRLETVEQTKAETVTVEDLSKTLDTILTDVIPALTGV